MINWDFLDQLTHEDHEEVVGLLELEDQPIPIEDDTCHKVWDSIKSKDGGFELCTRFTESELEDIWNDCAPFAAQARTRGPKPKISLKDSLVVLLMLYKFNFDYVELGSQIGEAKSTTQNACDRILPILNKALVSRWWTSRKRPERSFCNDFPYIILAVDTNSFPVYRPRGHFSEAKAYWDAKNKIYALKKEVAVRTVPPHYALFSQPSRVGSTRLQNL